MHWYAFKVFYNKVFEIEDSLNRDKIETYIPCERILVERGGVKKYVRKPIISSLLFFYSTEKQALALQQKLTDRVLLYTRLVNWQKLPIAIPVPMEYNTGERVLVTDGPFKGAEGCIHRIKGNRRLIVAIQGVCAVATAYIPQCFLRKI